MFGITLEWWILYCLIIVIAFVGSLLFMKGVEGHKRTLQNLLIQISKNLKSVTEVNRRLEAVLQYYFPYKGEEAKVGIDSLSEELREINTKLQKITHELYELKKAG